MSDLNEIKTRLKGAVQTRQITNAVYLISASAMKRSLGAADGAEKRLNALKSCLGDVLSYRPDHKIAVRFTRKKEDGASVFAVLTSDKGLCGGYNNEIASFTLETLKSIECESRLVYCFGKRGKAALKTKKIIPDVCLPFNEGSSLTQGANRICGTLKELYDTGKANGIFVIYYDCKLRKPVCERLFPIDPGKAASDNEIIYFEPSFEQAAESIVSLYAGAAIRKMMIHASASENTKRTEAMRSATENADEMISSLQTELNTARQLIITNEITETAAAAENLNGC